jgi:DNA polymerase II large subunit
VLDSFFQRPTITIASRKFTLIHNLKITTLKNKLQIIIMSAAIIKRLNVAIDLILNQLHAVHRCIQYLNARCDIFARKVDKLTRNTH